MSAEAYFDEAQEAVSPLNSVEDVFITALLSGRTVVSSIGASERASTHLAGARRGYNRHYSTAGSNIEARHSELLSDWTQRSQQDNHCMTTAEPTSLSRYTLSIKRHGGRSESGALSLERHLKNTSGVHDADVSFRTGSVRITYDDSIISVDELEQTIRERGVTLKEQEDETEEARTSSELRVEAGSLFSRSPGWWAASRLAGSVPPHSLCGLPMAGHTSLADGTDSKAQSTRFAIGPWTSIY